MKRALDNLSIRKSFMLYMLIFLLVAALLSGVAIGKSSEVRNNIFFKYNDSNEETSYKLELINRNYTNEDQNIIKICGYVETWSIPIFFGLCIILSSLLFYRNKLKKPLEILSMASEKIANNDLDFHILHDSKDEMGELCGSFEKMRTILYENNKQMWRSLEERKQLNVAFSHDLRTPLTVLRGYTDFLNNYLPQGKVSSEKLISTVSTMSAHILRLENYVQMMGETQVLDETSVFSTQVDMEFFHEQLKSTAEILSQGHTFNITFVNNITEKEMKFDVNIVMRVFENILSNAIRYVDQKITVYVEQLNSSLIIKVSDDGPGFSVEDLKRAIEPFYKSEVTSDGVHFGLGLHIANTLTDKHGGEIKLTNNENGGATVIAMFLFIS
jgi:signal transduction histidine kinase